MDFESEVNNKVHEKGGDLYDEYSKLMSILFKRRGWNGCGRGAFNYGCLDCNGNHFQEADYGACE